MIIGVPNELPTPWQTEENRVGLPPAGVKELRGAEVRILVENKAGEGAGFSNEAYKEAGAEIVYSKEEIYKRSDIVIKVERPVEDEWKLFREGQAILGFLNPVTAPKEFLKILIEKRITAIGYELITQEDGTLPVLRPMSQIAGKTSLQLAGRLLESTEKGRRGILIGGIPGIPPAEVAILGGGTLGFYAAETLSAAGANVCVMDRNIEKLERIENLLKGRVVTILYSRDRLEKLCRFCDVLIGCVFIPGERAPVLVSKEMVRSMKKGAVIIDFSIDQGGCVETSRLTPRGNPYIEERVVHLCVPNITAWVPRTATYALYNALSPYFDIIVKEGVKGTLKKNRDLRTGTYTFDGYIVNPHLRRENLSYSKLEDVLAQRI